MDNETTPPQSLFLPHDIEEDILSRLPVKSLLRFKCVSKPWLSLIESNRFVKKHLQNYSNNTTYDHRSVIMDCFVHGLNKHASSLRSYLDESLLDLTHINDPKNKHLMSTVIVGSCNGLFCSYKFNLPWEWCFFLWNPAIRVSIELPKLELPYIYVIRKWGFGLEEESGAYKVFVVMSDGYDPGTGRVYSSKTNSWKIAEHMGNVSSLCCPFGMVARGKIHWLLKSGHLETFDLKSEVFGTMELSNEMFGMMKLCVSVKDNFLCLSESMGFLKVVCRNNKDVSFRVWVMKEYGVKESWVEEIFKTPKKISRCCGTVSYAESLVSPLFAKEVLCSTSQNPTQVGFGWIRRAKNGLMMKLGLKRRGKKT